MATYNLPDIRSGVISEWLPRLSLAGPIMNTDLRKLPPGRGGTENLSNRDLTAGIMRGGRNREDLRRASQGNLLFTAEQPEFIRAEARARLAQQEAEESALMTSQQ